MKLFLIIYNAAGLITGVVGPLPPGGLIDCETYIFDARNKMKLHPEMEQLRFECEYADIRPQLQGNED